LCPEVPPDLETVVLKAVAREPARRYASAQALADDLRRFLAGEPVRARTLRPWERALLWARRRPSLAALLLVRVVATLALAALGVRIYYARQLEAALQTETEARQLAEERGHQAEEARGDLRAVLYVHRVVRAGHEWRLGRLLAARELLDQCPRDLHGWEWHYL